MEKQKSADSDPPAGEAQKERARLRQIIAESWGWHGQGEMLCGLCGAIVGDHVLHLEWHLRNLQ